jgi:hypothetical protein
MEAWGTFLQTILDLLINAIGRFIGWLVLIAQGQFVADPVAIGVAAVLVLLFLAWWGRRQRSQMDERIISTLQQVAVKQPVVVQSPGGVFTGMMIGFVSGIVILALLVLFVF